MAAEVQQQQHLPPESYGAMAQGGAHGALPSRTGIPQRDLYNYHTLGPTLNAHVKQARVLMVGAGGIGCELLKTLVMSGFGEVHIVDLDTIDLSNLNRQFLFRHEHIKKSKALVAQEVAQRFNPSVKLVAHHANIKDQQFDRDFFHGFTIVFNALDNLDARRHVNRMCLAADVPLIESGTTGFNGQVQVIKKGVTACYDCSPKSAPKSFPVCTIRSTPSQPIHCIVWAKSYLLNEMFGDSEDESAFDHSVDAQNASEIAELQRESQALKAIRQAVGTPGFAERLFDKVFNTDVQRLRSMEDMWKSREPPEPLSYAAVSALVEACPTTNTEAGRSQVIKDGQKTWSLEESVVVFRDSIERLSRRVVPLRDKGADALIEFDKDDVDTLDFVAAGANIRSTLFGIERKSRFDIKQMAGNIIPAIATTNAIVASLCVLQSFKVLRGEYDSVKEVFLTPFSTDHFLASDQPRRPNPKCPVCSCFQVSIRADFSRATLKDIVEDFVKLQLGYGDRDFVVNNDVGILYDVEETENLDKKLSDLAIQPGSFLTITDDDDEDPFVDVVVCVQQAKEPLGDKSIAAISPETAPNIPKRPKKDAPATETNGAAMANGQHKLGDDGLAPATKRQRDGEDDQPATKKAKLAKASKTAPSGGDNDDDDDDVVVVDGPGPSGGAIVIED